MTIYNYNADDIEVLTMPDAIRKRPGMYLDRELPPQERLKALLIQAINNMFHMGLTPERFKIAIHDDHALTCRLHAPAFASMDAEHWMTTTPPMAHPDVSSMEILMALSHHVTMSTHQPHTSWVRRYTNGNGDPPLQGKASTDFTGVCIDFRLDPSFFEGPAIPPLFSLQEQLTRLAYFQPDTTLSCHDRRTSHHMTFAQPEGLKAMLCALTCEHDTFLPEPLYIECEALHTSLKVALQWSSSPEHILESRVSGDHAWMIVQTSTHGLHTDAVSQAMRHVFESHPQVSDPLLWHPVMMLDLHISLPYSRHGVWNDPLQLISPEIARSITHALTPLIEAHLKKV